MQEGKEKVVISDQYLAIAHKQKQISWTFIHNFFSNLINRQTDEPTEWQHYLLLAVVNISSGASDIGWTSVRPSVCPSHAGIVSKRLKLSSLPGLASQIQPACWHCALYKFTYYYYYLSWCNRNHKKWSEKKRTGSFLAESTTTNSIATDKRLADSLSSFACKWSIH